MLTNKVFKQNSVYCQMAKEEALTQLHLEKRRRTETEQKCSELNEKCMQLESRLRDLERSSGARVCYDILTSKL